MAAEKQNENLRSIMKTDKVKILGGIQFAVKKVSEILDKYKSHSNQIFV